MLQKMLTPKPTPHLTLTLTSKKHDLQFRYKFSGKLKVYKMLPKYGSEYKISSEIGCMAGLALKRKLQFRR